MRIQENAGVENTIKTATKGHSRQPQNKWRRRWRRCYLLVLAVAVVAVAVAVAVAVVVISGNGGGAAAVAVAVL